MRVFSVIVAIVSVALILLSVLRLEAGWRGIERAALSVDGTPVTLYAQPGAEGPLVVVAHGFAGSRQLMDPFALTVARAGYRVASFDFMGHGRHPRPMTGDVT
ncbi:MAG: alpha/beta fold hydrolase, partial [Pseudomonadota bacterium]